MVKRPKKVKRNIPLAIIRIALNKCFMDMNNHSAASSQAVGRMSSLSDLYNFSGWETYGGLWKITFLFEIERIDKNNTFTYDALMEIKEFEWNESNIEHIAKYGVSPDEVEDVAFDDAPWRKKGRKGTRYMLGYTVAGRYLFTVYILKSKGVAKVITSMDMDEKTRKLYKRRGK